ncbi:hypothetical protein NVP2275O_310 [Vibrio phage 2.275.O._10N.286.54.E11]|nr:hypothetical protein NVP2275O_310 [Vibrio phage 2.275.O._10N.286.54.E11]
MTNDEYFEYLHDLQKQGYMIYDNSRMVQDFISIEKIDGVWRYFYHEDTEGEIDCDMDGCFTVYKDVTAEVKQSTTML